MLLTPCKLFQHRQQILRHWFRCPTAALKTPNTIVNLSAPIEAPNPTDATISLLKSPLRKALLLFQQLTAILLTMMNLCIFLVEREQIRVSIWMANLAEKRENQTKSKKQD